MDGKIIQEDSVKKFSVSIYDNDTVIARGYIIINFNENDRPFGLIENIWTHPDHRRKGLGSNVMLQLIDLARKYNCYKCLLSCAEHNLHFYHHLGFYTHQNNMRIDL
jgi:GNAT superfamily N-acetyltransferase